MKPVRDIISREVIDDLWGAGYTILPRNRHPDPFFVQPEIIPQGRAYQWMHLVHDQTWIKSGWAAVPASRHDGYFMPTGFVGDIEVNGLGLFEKPKFEVDQERAAQTAAAHKQVDDWKERWGGQFSGEAIVGVERTEIGSTKTIENTTKIPRDMVPYIALIFEERDRLGAEQVAAWKNSDADPTEVQRKITAQYNQAFENGDGLKPIPKWPTLNAILLPYAIENVRKRITEEASPWQ